MCASLLGHVQLFIQTASLYCVVKEAVAEENSIFPVRESNVYDNMCVLAYFIPIKICCIRKKLSSKVKTWNQVVLKKSTSSH